MKNEWVYYLNLSAQIDINFINLDKHLKSNSLSLVPVDLEDIYSLSRSKEKIHVVIVIDNISKLKYFNNKIRKIMMLLLRRDSMNFYLLSSFENTNDKKYIFNRNNYFFSSLPCSLSKYSYALSETIAAKNLKRNEWPGAKRRVHISGEKL